MVFEGSNNARFKSYQKNNCQKQLQQPATTRTRSNNLSRAS